MLLSYQYPMILATSIERVRTTRTAREFAYVHNFAILREITT
jgi:hypothetical protein